MKKTIEQEGIWGRVNEDGTGEFEPLPDGPELRAILARRHGFEILGFFEEVHVDEGGGKTKCVGTRNVRYCARPFGSKGKRNETWIENTILTRGHKTILVKASHKKPVRVATMLQILCGKRI